eukprot:3776665-Alexandrium_andersonii.AAC.1
MSASLVGSEMCIRDREGEVPRAAENGKRRAGPAVVSTLCPVSARRRTVSYTHLTLPTICSV